MNWQEREKLRDKGQFWTPEWITKAMVSYLVKSTDLTIDLIFDPAAGKGAFFHALLQIHPHINYYGIDIDTDILQYKIYQTNPCFIEVRDFIKNPPEQKFNAIIGNPPYVRHHFLGK